MLNLRILSAKQLKTLAMEQKNLPRPVGELVAVKIANLKIQVY